MPLIPPQVTSGVAVFAAISIGVASAAGGFAAAWKWRSAEVARAESRLADLSSTVREVGRADSIRSQAASKQLAEMEQTLRAQVALEGYVREQYAKRLDEVTNRGRMCLSGRTISVLRAAQGGRADPRPNPTVDAGAAPGPAAAAGAGLAGLSEFATARYLNVCMSRYREAQLRFVNLAAKVETLPCVTVIEDE